jgi:hypothetical protein
MIIAIVIRNGGGPQVSSRGTRIAVLATLRSDLLTEFAATSKSAQTAIAADRRFDVYSAPMRIDPLERENSA